MLIGKGDKILTYVNDEEGAMWSDEETYHDAASGTGGSGAEVSENGRLYVSDDAILNSRRRTLTWRAQERGEGWLIWGTRRSRSILDG